jgi:hypothetical protein
MKFQVIAVEHYYYNNDMERLKKLGFKFEPYGKGPEFTVVNREGVTIEINTLEQLMEFIASYGEIFINKTNIYINVNDYI